VQSDEPALHALARRVIGRETDAWRASLELERWVADSMHFDLGVVFAPSVEVLEQRRGSRVAYATLLAALTRTVGIPSRVVFGFAYVNGIF
jgi:transglutaminase-like putative cysteine protease